MQFKPVKSWGQRNLSRSQTRPQPVLQRQKMVPRSSVGPWFDMQRTLGNEHVQRFLALARQGKGSGEVSPEIEQKIDRARGGGKAIDQTHRLQMEAALGADFSHVRVHTDTEADTLNRQVNAVAFTTGSDIFFRQGEYRPESSNGRELLAHELTHVVQQDGASPRPGAGQRGGLRRKCHECEGEAKDGIQRKLVVGQPDDQHEREAENTATSVVRRIESDTRLSGKHPGHYPSEPIRRQPNDAQAEGSLATADASAQAGPTSNGCRRTLDVPCPGSLSHAVEIPPPEGLSRLEDLQNEGSCQLSIGGLDASGAVIEPHVTLDSGESLQGFRPPPGAVKTVVACFKDCCGIGKLSYSYLCS
jgi:Domain of unknown function (DUF4157)